jgi:hypothetical protein
MGVHYFEFERCVAARLLRREGWLGNAARQRPGQFGGGACLCQPAHEYEVSSGSLEQAVIALRQWRGASSAMLRQPDPAAVGKVDARFLTKGAAQIGPIPDVALNADMVPCADNRFDCCHLL